MTNEEKALELMPTMSGYYDIMNALLNMANWKDEQLESEKQQWIDKACEWLRKNTYEGTCEQILSKKPYPFMSDFINEFKNAMKGE